MMKDMWLIWGLVVIALWIGWFFCKKLIPGM